MKCRILFLVIFSLFIQIGFAQTTAPKYSNAFLDIGVGARAFGMSNAVTAVTEDVTAGYWNPAGLHRLKSKYEVALMHAEYFAGIAKYDYAGIASRLDSMSVIGLSMIRFGVDDIPDTRFLFDPVSGQIDYNNIRYFAAADYAFILSYARIIPKLKGISTGANFKIIHRTVGPFANSWGFGLDVGAQYAVKSWQFGIMGRDITTTFNAWSVNTELLKDAFLATGNELPVNSLELTLPKLILGSGKSFLIKKKIGLLATADVTATFDRKRNVLVKSDVVSLDPSLGLELDYKKIVFLRGGVGNYQKIRNWENQEIASFQPNFGIGIKVYRFSIDYALTDLGNTSEALYSNIFSLKVNLN